MIKNEKSYGRAVKTNLYQPFLVDSRLYNFTLPNAKRFYSSRGDVSDRKGFKKYFLLKDHLPNFSSDSCKARFVILE